MSQENQIINRVANSGIVTIDIKEFYTIGERTSIDIAPILFNGLVLREKDLRDYISITDWSVYTNKFVSINCSVDAIIPMWAFMLIEVALKPYATYVCYGNSNDLETLLLSEKINNHDFSQYQNARVVIKGCSDISLPVNAYILLTSKLLEVVKSLMFGEPCSTVPLFKSK